MTNIVNPSLSPQLINGQIADATQVMSLLNSIVSQINTNGLALADLPTDMLSNLAKGSFIAPLLFGSSGTYTPTPGSTKGFAIGVGGGGAGGGAQATGASQNTAGSGGNAGSWGLAFWSSAIGAQTVTIGAGGTGVAGGNGNAGGTTTFGSGLATFPGGSGGGVGTVAGAVPPSSGLAPLSTGTLLLYGTTGNAGASVPQISVAGNGGNSIFGPGSVAVSPGGTPFAAPSVGAGGAGFCNSASSGNNAGAAGAHGALLIFEFI